MEAVENHTLLNKIKFILLITLQIPGIILTLLIFTFLITHRTMLKDVQNQPLIFLLIINFLSLTIDLPMPINFYRLGYVSPATAGYCTWWTFFEYSFNLASELLMGTISIQRHILIFHSNILQVRWKRYIYYYLPLLLSLIYPNIFYLFAIVIYPCDGTQWDFTSNGCGYNNCYILYDKVLSTYDWIADDGLPAIIIIFSDTILVIRVIYQKSRRVQGVSWRKQRRMTLQLLGISSLYLIALLPSVVIGVIQEFSTWSFYAQIQSDYALDLTYLVCPLLPWIYFGIMPKFTKWIVNGLHRVGTSRNIVHPLN
jgi:hypothetical protein